MLSELTAHLFAFIRTVVAAVVTMHVLLHKRDVRAAIGWIGLTWLSPLIGALLYYVFGINRVTRRALRLGRGSATGGVPAQARGHAPHAFPANIEIIAMVGERLARRSLRGGNAVTILHGGDEAYPAMLAAISAARKSVALSSYIFRIDAAGLPLVEALSAARSRGVEVRVLVDGVGSGYLLSPVVHRLTRAGVTVGRFLHDWRPWKMSFINLRNHKKLLVVDGAVGFTGGLNIGAENLLSAHPANPVDDLHFRVAGPVVAQLLLTFAEDWNDTTGELLEGEAWWPSLPPAGAVLARGIESGPDQDTRPLETLLATAAGAARHRLRIVTPYFLPDQHIMSTIAAAALGGVAVDIVIPERTDFRVLDWAMRAHVAFFANSSVRLFLAPPPFDHTKLTTVDGRWCLVGSGNWDVRSTRLNFEFELECYDETLLAALDQLIDGKIARARPVRPEWFHDRPVAPRLRDATARLLLPYL